jgi:hypothetical protein
MAGHAGFGRRDAGEGRMFDRVMAIAAIDAETADVMLMAEGYRLTRDVVDASQIGRADQRETDAERQQDEKKQRQERDSRKTVGSRSEDLSHLHAAPFTAE